MRLASALLVAAAAAATPAFAAEDASCQAVRLSDPGWTDITSTNAIASALLTALGYEPEVKTLSVPIGYEAMKNERDRRLPRQLDAGAAALPRRPRRGRGGGGHRRRTSRARSSPLRCRPQRRPSSGSSDFKDLAAHGDAFDEKIYGIETGAPANQSLQKMIDAERLRARRSGAGRVRRAGDAGAGRARREVAATPIVFLAWAPHPMNTAHELTYLSGGDAYFGPDFGGGDGLDAGSDRLGRACPNAAKFFRNLVFDVDMENEMMGMILDDGEEANDAADGLDHGESRPARRLARRRHHLRRAARAAGGQGGARHLGVTYRDDLRRPPRSCAPPDGPPLSRGGR